VTLALLHRRLTAALALSALVAFAAGAGATPALLLVGGAIAAAAVRLPPPAWAEWVERGARLGILALCAWMLYVAFVLRQDFMPAVMAMLLFLLVAESARSLEARNDGRLYLLSFSLLLAATAFYPGLAFAAAFVAYVVLATLALTVGYLRRQAERFSVPGVRPGRGLLATLVALSAVTLLVSATLFVLFPRLPRQWNVQGRRPGGEMMAGFSDEVRLGQHGGRIGSNPETAFRVEFLDAPPASPGSIYWRGRSFDHFDGVRWSRTRGMGARSWGRSSYAARWEGGTQRMRIFGGPPEARVLFGPHAVLAVEPRSAIRVMQEASGDVVFLGSDAPVYTVVSTARQPSDATLRAAVRETGVPGRYLQLPALDPAVGRLADSLTAGHEHRVDRVRAVERYLRGELAYSLDLPRTAAEATVEGFLFSRRAGHCEYFSTAMVALLRSVGIPARNVTGFAGGEWNEFGGYLVVTGDQAHSWVEVWFGEMG
jgi:protein-glutamine gamma-glutamyltransferase